MEPDQANAVAADAPTAVKRPRYGPAVLALLIGALASVEL